MSEQRGVTASNKEKNPTRDDNVESPTPLAGALFRSAPALATKMGRRSKHKTHQRPGERRGRRRGGSFLVV